MSKDFGINTTWILNGNIILRIYCSLIVNFLTFIILLDSYVVNSLPKCFKYDHKHSKKIRTSKKIAGTRIRTLQPLDHSCTYLIYRGALPAALKWLPTYTSAPL